MRTKIKGSHVSTTGSEFGAVHISYKDAYIGLYTWYGATIAWLKVYKSGFSNSYR